MYLLISKFNFLEFWLLLSRVAPYYSSLPRTVLQFWNNQLLAKLLLKLISIKYIAMGDTTKNSHQPDGKRKHGRY